MLLFKTPVIALVLATLVGACGFRPLYGTQQSETLSAHQNLALIQIKQIKDRPGQLLRNNLLSRINAKGEPANPQYALTIILTESIANLGVKKSAVVTRGNLTVTASYSLTTLQGHSLDQQNIDIGVVKTLTSGSVQSISSYDIPQAQYTAIVALKDARSRAIREIADDLKIRLAVYFQQAAN